MIQGDHKNKNDRKYNAKLYPVAARWRNGLGYLSK